jgi:hypothetical protein
VELAPRGPQRADLAEDIAVTLQASPAAAAFFGKLGQSYRKAHLRYIEATSRIVPAGARLHVRPAGNVRGWLAGVLIGHRRER